MRWSWVWVLVTACGPRALLSTPTTPVGAPPAATAGGAAPTVDVSAPPTDPPGGVVWSRLPAPHRLAPAPAAAVASAAAARRLVGHRDRRDPLALAIALAADLTGGARIPARTAVELVAWAQDRGAWKAVPAIVAGDLLVFDRAVGGAPASLVAVALGRDDRGVIEMLYVAQGVVRRGFVDPARPRLVRDRDRRAVNTYLRHGRDQPPAGTRYLAGELFAGVVAAAAR